MTLDQAKVVKVKLPVAPEKEADLIALLEKKLPGATKTISLDRLEASSQPNRHCKYSSMACRSCADLSPA
ncbi:MAG TPA: hypothetical protein VGR71_03870, partial [Nitrospira sp.]|nr:hypothetical protein [Nitrospira sp.]